MKNRIYRSFLFILALINGTTILADPFSNLDFENPPLTEWTVHHGDHIGSIGYNMIPLADGPYVSLVDSNVVYWPGPLNGQFSISIGAGMTTDTSFAQTGFLPQDAERLRVFSLYDMGTNVFFQMNSNTIPWISIVTNEFIEYMGDISAYAGQIAEFRILAVAPDDWGSGFRIWIDDISIGVHPASLWDMNIQYYYRPATRSGPEYYLATSIIFTIDNELIGITNEIQRSPTMISSDWSTVHTYVSSKGLTNWTQVLDEDHPQMYYRIQQP